MIPAHPLTRRLWLFALMLTLAFTAPAQTSTVQYLDGKPAFMSNQLLISFHPNQVNNAAIDNPDKNTGALTDFVKTSALDTIQKRTGINLKYATAEKIFRRMQSKDSLSIARSGDTVKVFPFWATFKVYVPTATAEVKELQMLSDTLRSVYPVVLESGLNMLYQFQASANDSRYFNEQLSLHINPNAGFYFPNSHINVGGAWAMHSGSSTVKVGVIDSGIRWTHEDFGNGTLAGSNVGGGWDYFLNSPITGQSGGGWHGTNVAGIIGAIRNNSKGIAGIAGGNRAVTTAVQLYSLVVSASNGAWLQETTIANAIVDGSTRYPTSPNGFGFGLDVLNASFGGPSSSLVGNAVKTCFQNDVVLVAGRGNDGAAGNPTKFPACYRDEWVINVSASGSDGNFKHRLNGLTTPDQYDNYTSSYGNGVDIMAPGTKILVTSTSNDADNAYGRFNGTSSATPHVAGVVALLKGYYNPTHPSTPLCPEEVEQILQKSASDRSVSVRAFMPTGAPDQAVGYDDLSGWGMVDATAALNYVERGRREIYRPDGFMLISLASITPGLSRTLVAQNQIRRLTAAYGGIAAGFYKVDIYKITKTTNHFTGVNTPMPTGATVLDGWPLQSRSNLWALETNNTIVPRTQVTLEGWNATSSTMSGYAYLIKTRANDNEPINTFLPFSPFSGGSFNIGTIRLGSSLVISLPITPNPCPTCVPQRNLDVTIYPNPTADDATLSYENETVGTVTIDLLDTQGNQRQHIERLNVAAGAQTDLLDLDNVPTGLYTVRVITPTAVMTETISCQ